ncbi:MAG: preprotein translocase subunit SecG [Holosporaceae bacterium]|jgi:preprotein translocase subunit SecG|nr:preprotein translocase subunit SecG [Holosporaceae bacterium]
MIYFLLSVHFILAIAIIGIVLLQKHDSDGALGSSGGGAASGVFSVRGQANFLTRSTAIMMSLFIINCLVMAKMLKHSVVQKESLIDVVAKESAANRNVAPEENSVAKKISAAEVTGGNGKGRTNTKPISRTANTKSSGNAKVPEVTLPSKSVSTEVSISNPPNSATTTTEGSIKAIGAAGTSGEKVAGKDGDNTVPTDKIQLKEKK